MACPTRRSPAARCSPPRRRAAPSAARYRSLLVMVPKPSWSLYRGRARGRESETQRTSSLDAPYHPGDRRPPLGARTFASCSPSKSPLTCVAVGAGHALEELDVQGRQPGGRGRDRAIAQCAAGDARPCGRPARSPQPRPESWHPSRAATAASTRTAVIEVRAGRPPAAWTPMCVPMTRIERARGDRIGRSALDPRDRPSALKEAGPMTTSVATTAPTEQTPRGSRAASSRTLTARPLCGLEGIRRSLTGIDCRSVQIEIAQRMIRYNRR